MQVRYLLFALYRDFAGVEELTLELPQGATAQDAVATLRARGTGFARIPAQPVVAINREYADLDATLADKDELALLPPVAGG
jgi:molybdopterin synthase catalytic subunit